MQSISLETSVPVGFFKAYRNSNSNPKNSIIAGDKRSLQPILGQWHSIIAIKKRSPPPILGQRYSFNCIAREKSIVQILKFLCCTA